MRKLMSAATIALAALTCLPASAGAAGSAQPGLTIEAVPSGIFGLVRGPSPKSCADGRKVVVLQQVGDAPDASDPQVGSDRAAKSEPGTYQWSVDLDSSGSFYAEAAAKPGCPALRSGAVEAQTVAAILGAESGSEYPVCGPYVSEGTSDICRFSQLHISLEQEGVFNPCRYGPSKGSCPGRAQSGPFPWGFGRPLAQVGWRWDGSKRIFEVATGGSAGRLDGSVPNSNSNRFTVINAFARNDRGGGDNFFTPDLPGQAPGEVGGPLNLNFENGSGTDFGAQVWISGYLYLKR